MPIYMKIDGVHGSVGAGPHKGWIELDSAQLGINRHVTSPTGRGTNREAAVPAVSELIVTKSLDISSTQLYKLSLWGEGKKVTIDFVKTDKAGKEIAPYLSVELENTLISSYSVSGTGGSATSRPMESLALNFTKITYTQTATSASDDPQAVKDRALWDLAVKGSK